MICLIHFLLTKDRGKKWRRQMVNHRPGLQKRRLELVQESAWKDPIGAPEEVVGSLPLEIFKIWPDKGLSDLLWLNLWSMWSGERLHPEPVERLQHAEILLSLAVSLLNCSQTLLLPSSPLLPLQSLKAGPPHFLWKIMHCHYLTEFSHLLPNLMGFAGLVKADLNKKKLDISLPPFFLHLCNSIDYT